MFIDTHCHLDLSAFSGDRDLVLARAGAAGVAAVLVPAIRPETWAGLVALRDEVKPFSIWLAVGVHPQIVPELSAQERALSLDVDALAAAATRCGAVAIGECGLDGGTEMTALQEDIFRAHLRAARLAQMPVVIHVLKAHDAALRILRQETLGPAGGVLHSYSGGPDLVPVYARLGLHFAFAGPVTYAGSRRPVAAARVVPKELLLAETDGPDQAPVPHRGSRCEPAHVVEVVAGLARARGVDPFEVAAITTQNARRLFGCSPEA